MINGRKLFNQNPHGYEYANDEGSVLRLKIAKMIQEDVSLSTDIDLGDLNKLIKQSADIVVERIFMERCR